MPRNIRFLPVFLATYLFFVCIPLVCGQDAKGMSESDILRLHAAGVSDATIIHQIQHDGVAFHVDANTTIRLKSGGISDTVIDFLLTGNTDSTAAVATVDPIKTLYAQGKYPELCDYLKSQLSSDPKNYRDRTILIGALLKINQQADALRELETLKGQSSDPASKTYIERASLLVSTWQKQQEGKQRLMAALQNYNYADADSAVDQLPASALQKQLLHILVDAYAAKFDSALARKSQLSKASFVEQKQIELIGDRINDSQKQYLQLMDRVDFYLHSPRAWACSEADWKKDISVSNYVDVVSKLSQIAPLSSQVMNLAFHATLLSTNYENLQAVGDKILAVQDMIRIPFYSRDRYFELVIDNKSRTLYSQPDSHPFQVACGSHGFAELISFNLPFDQIRRISQKAGDSYGRLVVNAHALSFEPAGVAPNYALMHMLYYQQGGGAGMQATRNLGQFLLHVIGNPNMKASLADPKKAGRRGFLDTFADTIVMTYGGGAALAQVNEMRAQEQREQQATWLAALARDYSSLWGGSVFDGLDKLVEAQ